MSDEQKKEATDMNQTLPVCICGATRVSDTFCDECGLPPRVGEQQTAPASPIPTEREDCEGARACPTWKDANSSDELEAFYKSVIPAIRDAARDCGYAIGVHGSMRRDLDLIAVPWVDEHASSDCLAEVVQLAACGFKQESYTWELKSSGRVAATFPICWNESGRPSAGHIDLSVALDTHAADDEGRDYKIHALERMRVELSDAHVLNAYQAAEIADYRGRCDNYRNDLCSARLIEAALRVGVHKATGLPTDYTDTSHLNAIDDLKRKLDAAKVEAETLCMAIYSRKYKTTSPDFELCDSVAGVISQIDNMVAGVLEDNEGFERKLDAARVALKRTRSARGGPDHEAYYNADCVAQKALVEINGSGEE